jgi:uncharacterized cupin superfamily protein
MGIVHIIAAAQAAAARFDAPVTAPAVGDSPSPRLSTLPAYEAADDSVSTGTWEATPGVFARAIVDAEFSHFVAGHASFVTADGQRFEFRAGDAAYFPPHTKGVWTIHQTLRKTYCIWR